ncbi:MAG: helix-turn-helix transcriptional regulator [Bacillota bacterium]
MDKETIKDIRKQYEMTQREFAQKINCSYSLIALVECGKRRITDNLTHKIQAVFNQYSENQRKETKA